MVIKTLICARYTLEGGKLGEYLLEKGVPDHAKRCTSISSPTSEKRGQLRPDSSELVHSIMCTRYEDQGELAAVQAQEEDRFTWAPLAVGPGGPSWPTIWMIRLTNGVFG